MTLWFNTRCSHRPVAGPFLLASFSNLEDGPQGRGYRPISRYPGLAHPRLGAATDLVPARE